MYAYCSLSYSPIIVCQMLLSTQVMKLFIYLIKKKQCLDFNQKVFFSFGQNAITPKCVCFSVSLDAISILNLPCVQSIWIQKNIRNTHFITK